MSSSALEAAALLEESLRESPTLDELPANGDEERALVYANLAIETKGQLWAVSRAITALAKEQATLAKEQKRQGGVLDEILKSVKDLAGRT
jgi:hypothetical protein